MRCGLGGWGGKGSIRGFKRQHEGVGQAFTTLRRRYLFAALHSIICVSLPELTLNSLHAPQLINELVKSRPEDPFIDLSQTIESKSPIANQIVRVHAREIIGSDGSPALEVEVETLRGIVRSVVAGVGPYDGNVERYGGKGVKDAVSIILTVLGDKLIGKGEGERRLERSDSKVLYRRPTYLATLHSSLRS